MSNNNLNEEKPKKWIFIVVTIVAILLPFTIFGAVYCVNISKMPIFYDKKDVLVYYGSIFGSCFTGFITAGGLYYTLNQNYKSITKQRQFDTEVMEKHETQFNKDYNLRLINQKLDTYKEIYLVIEEIINKVVDIRSKVYTKGYLGVDGVIYTDIEKIYEIHNKFVFMSIFITEPDLINYYNEIKLTLMNLIHVTNKYHQHEMILKQYDDYYERIMKEYAHLSTMLKDTSEDIYKKNILIHMKVKYSN